MSSGRCAEAADGKRRPVQRQRRDDGVDARAVGQPGIDHRRLVVDPPPHAADHPLDDLHQVLFVGEDRVGLLQPAAPLHVDLVRPVDQDVGDVGILHVGLQRPQAERLGHQLVDQPLLVDAGEHFAPRAEELLRQVPDVAPQMGFVQRADPRQVERVDQLAVQARLQLLKIAFEGIGRIAAGRPVRPIVPGGVPRRGDARTQNMGFFMLLLPPSGA